LTTENQESLIVTELQSDNVDEALNVEVLKAHGLEASQLVVSLQVDRLLPLPKSRQQQRGFLPKRDQVFPI
jgi:hypothetical protein